MKKIFILFLLSCSFISCEKELTKEQILIKKIEDQTIPDLNDPDSYEFVSLTSKDTLMLSKHYKDLSATYYFQHTAFPLNYYPLDEGEIIVYNRSKRDTVKYKSIYNHYRRKIENHFSFIKNSKQKEKYYDSLAKNLKEDKPYRYFFEYKYRDKNKFGGLELNSFTLTLNDSLSIVKKELNK